MKNFFNRVLGFLLYYTIGWVLEWLFKDEDACEHNRRVFYNRDKMVEHIGESSVRLVFDRQAFCSKCGISME